MWDPIGVADEPLARHEYTGYTPQIWRMVRDGASAVDIANHLATIAVELMGLRRDGERAQTAADALLRARDEVWRQFE